MRVGVCFPAHQRVAVQCAVSGELDRVALRGHRRAQGASLLDLRDEREGGVGLDRPLERDAGGPGGEGQVPRELELEMERPLLAGAVHLDQVAGGHGKASRPVGLRLDRVRDRRLFVEAADGDPHVLPGREGVGHEQIALVSAQDVASCLARPERPGQDHDGGSRLEAHVRGVSGARSGVRRGSSRRLLGRGCAGGKDDHGCRSEPARTFLHGVPPFRLSYDERLYTPWAAAAHRSSD